MTANRDKEAEPKAESAPLKRRATGSKPSTRKPATKRAPAKRAPAKRAPAKRAAKAAPSKRTTATRAETKKPAARRSASSKAKSASTRKPAAKSRSAANQTSSRRSTTSSEVPSTQDGVIQISDFEQAWEKAVANATARRTKNPDADITDLYMQLLREKCLRAGTLGAATSVASLIPGLGTIASFAIDGIGDAAFTAKLQHELALDTFALYGRKPDEKERMRIATWISTFGAGGSELIEQVGKMVARQLAKNLAGRLLRRGLPFAEVAYSTATHLAGTYFVGRRSQLYCIGLSDAESEILLESEKGIKLQVRRMKMLAQESVEAMEERFGKPGRTLAVLFRKLTGTDKD